MTNEMVGKIVFPNKIREFGCASWIKKTKTHLIEESIDLESNYVILSGPLYDRLYGWYIKVLPFGYGAPCFLYYKEVYEDSQTQGQRPQFHMEHPDNLPLTPDEEEDEDY